MSVVSDPESQRRAMVKAAELRKRAEGLPDGTLRDHLLERAERYEALARKYDWIPAASIPIIRKGREE